MLGYSDLRESGVWVQTNKATKVQLHYWPSGDKSHKSKSVIVNTKYTNAFIAQLVATDLEPGTQYDYQIKINGKSLKVENPVSFKTQHLWQWRTDPPSIKIALGSCAYINQEKYDRPGKPYGGEYEIFDQIAKSKPDLMLWLGDNTYLRETDWNSVSGIYSRNTHTRSLPELQKLLRSAHNYAIWDDHDYGPNNSDRSFSMRETTLNAFRDFWMNPNYDVPACGGITGMFSFGDLDFFLLDNRWNRTAQGDFLHQGQILGKCQIDWLLDALKFSQASFKFICVGGQVLNSAEVGENYSNYPIERDILLSAITKANIKGVVFLTGDRHHTELSKLVLNDVKLYDFTVSPLTSGSGRNSEKEGNRNRVEGTYVGQRNFGTIEVSGRRNERKAVLSLFSNKGELIWSRELD